MKTRDSSAGLQLVEYLLRDDSPLMGGGFCGTERDVAALYEFVRGHRSGPAPAPVRLPKVYLDNVISTPADWRKVADQVVRFECDRTLAHRPAPETICLLREQGELKMAPSGWGLSSPEWRLLHAVLAIYSESGIEGDAYRIDAVEEDWPRIYRAAGLPEVETRDRGGDFSHKRREDLRAALSRLAHEPGRDGGRRVPVFIKRRRSDGKWEIEATDCYVLERRPYWVGVEGRAERELLDMSPEERPEPDGWRLRVNPGLRIGLDNFWRLVPGDLWQRLEAGSRDVVGVHRGVQARDYGFALWLAAQRPQEEPGTGRYLVRVDRLELADRVPALREYKRRRQRAYLDKYTLQTYEVALRAGLLRGFHLDVERARRDVFELDPRTWPALERKGQLEITASPAWSAPL